MKTFRKWLVVSWVEGKLHTIASFNTKNETKMILDMAGFTQVSGDCFENSKGELFYITKNVREYGV